MTSSSQTISPERPLTVALPAALECSSRADVTDALRSRSFISSVLEAKGHIPVPLDITPAILRSRSRTAELLRSAEARCIFNLFEGFGEDSGTEHFFRSLVEETGIPCTGNPSHVLRTCLSKEMSCRILRDAGIPVPDGVSLRPGFNHEMLAKLRPPLFIKPLLEDGSVGVDPASLVTDRSELESVVSSKLSLFPGGVRVESFLPGREFSVACIGNDPYDIREVSVIDYEREGASLPFLDYGSKWDGESPLYALVPKKAEGALRYSAAKLAAAAGKALGCRGYFRVDLRERDGRLFVIDVNPNPDVAPDGGFFRQCRESGLSDEETVHTLLELAFEEHHGGTYRE
jgi:D-alanine-D-alanine ligase